MKEKAGDGNDHFRAGKAAELHDIAQEIRQNVHQQNAQPPCAATDRAEHTLFRFPPRRGFSTSRVMRKSSEAVNATSIVGMLFPRCR